MQTFDDVSRYDSEDDERNEVCIRQLQESQDWDEDTLTHQVYDAADTPEEDRRWSVVYQDIRAAYLTCSRCTPQAPSDILS